MTDRKTWRFVTFWRTGPGEIRKFGEPFESDYLNCSAYLGVAEAVNGSGADPWTFHVEITRLREEQR